MMGHGFLIGLGVGIVTAWFFYWRVSRLMAKNAFVKASIYRDVFSKATYKGLLDMREHLDNEISRRQAPSDPAAKLPGVTPD